jgi:hypothetical protein
MRTPGRRSRPGADDEASDPSILAQSGDDPARRDTARISLSANDTSV